MWSKSAAPVACLLTEAAGPVDVAYEPVERGRVSRDESPEQNPEEHVLAEAVCFAGQADQVWRPDWPAIFCDAGRDVPPRLLDAGKGQEGGEEHAVALTARLLTGFGRKTQPGITPRPGFVGESF